MGDSGSRKRSKKSKRSKRAKVSKKSHVAAHAEQPQAAPQGEEPDDGAVLSQSNQAVVIELQRTELSRLLREQQRLNDRVDRLLQLHEREQVLRQQMQASLDKLTAQRALPNPEHAYERDAEPNAVERRRLVERVDRAEGKFAALQSAVARLVTVLERRTASAQ